MQSGENYASRSSKKPATGNRRFKLNKRTQQFHPRAQRNAFRRRDVRQQLQAINREFLETAPIDADTARPLNPNDLRLPMVILLRSLVACKDRKVGSAAPRAGEVGRASGQPPRNSEG